MRTHLDVMAGEQVTVAEFNEHDTAFHVAIARASGNPLVTEMTIALRQAMRGTLLDRLSALPDFRATQRRLCREHDGIHDALRAGDGAWAADLVPNLTNVIDASVATHQPSRITPSEQETPS